MADEILLDYITTLLRTKGGGLQLAHAASVLSDAASSSLLLDARKTDNAAGLAEVSTKAKSLAQGKNTDQKVAGLRSLAVFAAQGSQAEFLSNFADWATDAMNPLRTWESQSEDVLDACWHLITAIMHRAGKLLHVPGVRRDAAPLATKITSAIVQPVQKGRAPTCEALHALHAALLAIPSSFKQHAKALEPILGGAVLTGTSSSSARTAAAVRCFAALPRAAGDADAWSSAAQRVLATAHSLLDTAYLNLEPPGLVDSCRQGLDPGAVPVAGTGLATPSSCPSDSSVSKLAAVDSYLLVFSQIEAVLATLCSQLTATYPMPVPLPTSAILLLATRLLSVDADSLSGRAAASTGKLAELCLRLPVLHSSAFVLLETLITAAGVQLTPLMMSIARLLGNQLGKVAVDPMEATNEPSSQYKKALFGATSTFLRSGGMAAARHLAPTVIQCSSVEFYGTAAPTEGAKGAGQFGTRRGEMQPPRKKAKHTQHAGDEFIGGTGAGNAGATSEIAALGSQMAFLGLLEAVLEGGAALLTPAQRAKIDDVIAHAASTSSDAALVAVHAAEGDASPLVGLQLAALKALLASVLAPAGHRPPHVALAVSLFRRGLRHQSNSIASFSNHALLSCEALLHPRALPRPAPIFPSSQGAGELGMPRFWSYVDADAWLKTQQAQHRIDGAEDMHVDDDGGASKANGKKKQGPKIANSAGFFAGVDKETKMGKLTTLGADATVPKAMPALAPLPELAAKRQPIDNKGTDTTAGKEQVEMEVEPAARAAAGTKQGTAATGRVLSQPIRAPAPVIAGDDSDDDESLPEIDSGASSSDEEES